MVFKNYLHKKKKQSFVKLIHRCEDYQLTFFARKNSEFALFVLLSEHILEDIKHKYILDRVFSMSSTYI